MLRLNVGDSLLICVLSSRLSFLCYSMYLRAVSKFGGKILGCLITSLMLR